MAYENIWKSQVLLCKASNIDVSTSDTFTKREFDLCFTTLEEYSKAQQEALNKG